MSPPHVLGKHPRPSSSSSPSSPLSLSSLPDPILLRILRFLAQPPRRGSPPLVRSALPLAYCSRHLLRLFRERILSSIDVVPDGDFLQPLPRCDARFPQRDPTYLCALARLAGPALTTLRLPLYDCSMHDGQWTVLESVAKHCRALTSLAFVDSYKHTGTTPATRQCEILGALLPALKHVTIILVRDPLKLRAMSTTTAFRPRTLVLHHILPRLRAQVLALLDSHGAELQALTLSFDVAGGRDAGRGAADLMLPFLQALSATVARSAGELGRLELVSGPRRNPLTALLGRSVSTTLSRREFDRVSCSVRAAKRGGGAGKGRPRLRRLVLERACDEVAEAVDVLATHCDAGTEIEVYLHEAVLVSPGGAGGSGAGGEEKGREEEGGGALPYFRATKLESSSWMVRELPASYFRQVEHIQVGADHDCTRRFPWAGAQSGGTAGDLAELESFRFLCEQSGRTVRSVWARMPIASAGKAKTMLRMLSCGFGYAGDVRALSLSGDAVRLVGVDEALLYSVVGQLRQLEEVHVSEAGGGAAGMQAVAVLIRGLGLFCQRLRSFKVEFSAFGDARGRGRLGDVRDALRELERQRPGVETHGLAELLEIALRHGAAEAAA